MADKTGARIVEKMMQQYGCLPSIDGGGQVIPAFERVNLATAIEQELSRAGDYGFTKITIHMDLPDAAKFARFLRGGK